MVGQLFAYVLTVSKSTLSGDQSDPNNYRVIKLTNCFSKLFTIVLNERLKSLADENSVLPAKFGFKKYYGCIDQVFILHSLVQRQITNKKTYIAALLIIGKHMTVQIEIDFGIS